MSSKIFHEKAQSNCSISTATLTTVHDYRFPRRPTDCGVNKTLSYSLDFGTYMSLPRNTQKINGTDHCKVMENMAETKTREKLLHETFFPTWKNDTAGEELVSTDEMRKKDPLATQVWRLYNNTKLQLPNQERMKNLTWRMMSMSLRKGRQQSAER